MSHTPGPWEWVQKQDGAWDDVDQTLRSVELGRAWDDFWGPDGMGKGKDHRNSPPIPNILWAVGYDDPGIRVGEDDARVIAAAPEMLALLRELNDALLPIPDALQARVDALLDRADTGPNFNQERDAHADTIATEYALSEKGPNFNQERNAHADTIAAEYESKREDERHDKRVLLTREQTTVKILEQLDERVWKTANDDLHLRLYSRYELECVRAALEAHSARGEPVAWRYTNKRTGDETFSNQPPDRVSDLTLYDYVPLYVEGKPRG